MNEQGNMIFMFLTLVALAIDYQDYYIAILVILIGSSLINLIFDHYKNE